MEEVGERLQAYLARVGPWAAPVVTELVSLSQGWESDVYGFCVADEVDALTPATGLVARLYVGEISRRKAQQEAAGMRCLYAQGYPVPRVALVEGEGTVLGTPFIVMEWVRGELLWPLLGRVDDATRKRLVDEFADLQARLHRVTWQADGMCGEVARRSMAQVLGEIGPFVARSGLAGLEPPLRWLEERAARVAPIAEGFVHWDYHPANVIVRDTGALVVIDWTQAEVTDPRFDLAWTLVVVGSQSGWELRDLILGRYEQVRGPVADLAWFELYACARRLYSVVISLHAGPESLGMRPGAAELMLKHVPALTRLYELWKAGGGPRIDAVERMLES